MCVYMSVCHRVSEPEILLAGCGQFRGVYHLEGFQEAEEEDFMQLILRITGRMVEI